MLDPLSSLSLASSIITAIEFASKVAKGTVQISRTEYGHMAKNNELEIVATHLTSILGRLPLMYRTSETRASSLKSDDIIAIENLSMTCRDLIKELLQVLESLKPSGPRKRWQSIQKALASVWSEEKLENYTERLRLLQESLMT